MDGKAVAAARSGASRVVSRSLSNNDGRVQMSFRDRALVDYVLETARPPLVASTTPRKMSIDMRVRS